MPESWLARDPGTGEVAEVMKAGAADSWPAVSDAIFSRVLPAYERQPERGDRLYGWLLAGRWTQLLGEREEAFVPRWIDAIERANVGHANMQATYEVRDRALGETLRSEFAAWALAHRPFLETFFEQLSPCDYLPRVLAILDELHKTDPVAFETYVQLALAIAFVYDVPPTPGWPHGQVGAAALKRQLPRPRETFEFFVRSDRMGKCLQRIAYLGAAELKFLVDIAASFEELAWAQANVGTPLAQLGETYASIAYRHDRAAAGAFVWNERTYTLPGIRVAGGICVDQAYFATQTAKARGVPTMIFRGSGLDGRHAWFGYLDGDRRWQLNAGRLAEQKLVTGLAHDPQTWDDLSDHELQFLSDGFRSTPRFRQALVQGAFAEVYLSRGNPAVATQAARRSVNYESRHLEGWEIYFAAAASSGVPDKAIEAALREASLAFQRYPDLNLHFSSLLTRRLRARGETSAADHEDRLMARKHQGERADLAFTQAMGELSRAVKSQPAFEQMRIFRGIVDQYGRGAGIAFFDHVVRPFSARLSDKGNAGDAARAVDYARSVLAPAPGSQLDREMAELSRSLRGSPAGKP